MAQDKRRDLSARVQVASVQTLVRWRTLPPADLVIVDEAHHACSPAYRKILGAYPHAFVVGLTATPWRSDNFGLADIFDAVTVGATVRELIERGALVDYDVRAFDCPKLHEVRVTSTGDFNQQQLGVACNTSVLVGDIVGKQRQYAAGRRTIVFAVNVAHSIRLRDSFRAAGVAAEEINASTPREERRAILARFAAGEVEVLTSVEVFTEGWDCPAAEVAVLACPTRSLVKHLQSIGRVLRPAPGKHRALILDHAGNLMRLGLPDEERDFSLTATKPREIARHTCPKCFTVFARMRDDGTCPSCGGIVGLPIEERQALEARQRREREQAEAQRELDKQAVIEARQRRVPRARRLHRFAQLIAEGRRRGYKPGWAIFRYKAIFGAPDFSRAEIAAALARIGSAA
jgi:superfamily II DNA or RNA helicase